MGTSLQQGTLVSVKEATQPYRIIYGQTRVGGNIVFAETTDNNLPKSWRKGKLLGVKGQEISDVQAKEWGLGTKAKAPAENKGK